DLEVRGDLGGKADELVFTLEERDPVTEIAGRRQSALSLWSRVRKPPPGRASTGGRRCGPARSHCPSRHGRNPRTGRDRLRIGRSGTRVDKSLAKALAPNSCRSLVEPSMSVKRKVTVPDGRLRIRVMMRRMLVYVTGASGFIGGHVVRELRTQGAEVRDEWIDLGDRERLRAAFEGCDAVFHLAALYSYDAPVSEHERVNVEGTRTVVELCC